MQQVRSHILDGGGRRGSPHFSLRCRGRVASAYRDVTVPRIRAGYERHRLAHGARDRRRRRRLHGRLSRRRLGAQMTCFTRPPAPSEVSFASPVALAAITQLQSLLLPARRTHSHIEHYATAPVTRCPTTCSSGTSRGRSCGETVRPPVRRGSTSRSATEPGRRAILRRLRRAPKAAHEGEYSDGIEITVTYT